MSQRKIINETIKPNTRTTIAQELATLGVAKGMTIIVHSSLKSLGWVCGGSQTVVQALMDVVGEEGTIVMPAQTGDNSDPADWVNPPVPREWWATIRAEMPAFDPFTTPSNGMGVIAETFRSWPGVKRSNHPTYSFTAWGKYSDYIISKQPLEAGFGLDSPLAKLYEHNGYILLLGVNHASNTSLHLAEHDIENRDIVKKGAAVMEDGNRVWKRYKEIEYDSELFQALGTDYEEIYETASSHVGQAKAKLFSQRQMIDFARDWLGKRAEM
ncbi:aminoglycoside N(3)-acetyltransferase [Aquibacillus salsiterrae]|uniref:Aminoglycoside N(3)-acetyltransferase n=1 Tax=Aquibacillus salsiterrae TaxID=2950439 RepID=A0A9X3WFI5_9BACI|nr:AAC(3) family N-acetyltransferase [Aquibacillus salsiterrae]MDC3417375.1 AAC(3) family N-acetyltransferase [Aquibacillus salsiterrae]